MTPATTAAPAGSPSPKGVTMTASAPATCPECGRPARGRAFATTAAYLRCAFGHVFPAAK